MGIRGINTEREGRQHKALLPFGKAGGHCHRTAGPVCAEKAGSGYAAVPQLQRPSGFAAINSKAKGQAGGPLMTFCLRLHSVGLQT